MRHAFAAVTAFLLVTSLARATMYTDYSNRFAIDNRGLLSWGRHTAISNRFSIDNRGLPAEGKHTAISNRFTIDNREGPLTDRPPVRIRDWPIHDLSQQR
jgi:hypothetical protein